MFNILKDARAVVQHKSLFQSTIRHSYTTDSLAPVIIERYHRRSGLIVFNIQVTPASGYCERKLYLSLSVIFREKNKALEEPELQRIISETPRSEVCYGPLNKTECTYVFETLLQRIAAVQDLKDIQNKDYWRAVKRYPGQLYREG